MKLEDELAFIREGIAILEDYLDSDLVYWSLRPFSASLPLFSLGGMLESLRRLEGLRDQLPLSVQSELERSKAQLVQLREARRDRYRRKLERELDSRLSAWAWYLEDYERHPEEIAASYPAQSHIRVKIDLLLEEGERIGIDTEKIRSRLSELDQILRRNWNPGPFLWEEPVQNVFPAHRFWWLYGRPRGR